jgi:hypothetical protein
MEWMMLVGNSWAFSHYLDPALILRVLDMPNISIRAIQATVESPANLRSIR